MQAICLVCILISKNPENEGGLTSKTYAEERVSPICEEYLR